MAVLGYLPKLNMGLGLVFGTYFLYDFAIKTFLIQNSINWQIFNVIPFFFLKISSKMCYYVLISTIYDVINFYSSSKAMTDRKKVEKTETQKLEYLENENRSIFHNYYFSKPSLG